MKHLHSEAWEGILKIISKQNHIKLQFPSTPSKGNVFKSGAVTARLSSEGQGCETLSVKNNLFSFHWQFRIDGSMSQDRKTDGRTSNSLICDRVENVSLLKTASYFLPMHAGRKKHNYHSSSSFFLVINISWQLNLRKSEKCLSRLPRAHEGISWFIQTVQHLFPVQISNSSHNF